MGRAWGVWLLLCSVLGMVACADPALACTDPAGCVRVGADEPIIIATLLDTSGPAQAVGGAVQRGVTLALAGRENMLLGHAIQVIEADTGCQEQGGVSGAQSLVETESVAGVIGTVCSQTAEAALPILGDAGLIMISPANTAPALTAASPYDPPAYFRTISPHQRQAEIMAAFAATEIGGETAVIFYDATVYANDLQGAFARAFVDRGGRISFQGQVASDLSDLDALVQTAAFYRPDVLYLALFEPEATPLLNQLRQNEALAEATLLGSDVLLTESFARGALPAVEGMYVTGTAVPDSIAYETFRQRWETSFETAYPTLREWPAYAYDATVLLLEAIPQATQVGGDGTLLIGRNALRQAVADTDAFPGLTGLLACDSGGDCASPPLAVYRLPDVELTGWPPPVAWRP